VFQRVVHRFLGDPVEMQGHVRIRDRNGRGTFHSPVGPVARMTALATTLRIRWLPVSV
jgi:hypothetical protein